MLAQLASTFKPRTLSLRGDGANHCTPVPLLLLNHHLNDLISASQHYNTNHVKGSSARRHLSKQRALRIDFNDLFQAMTITMT